MSLKRNILASYAAQIYVTLTGIIILPMYLKYMGSEAYGLVGFFTMLQAWFNLLDIGFTPMVARETARLKNNSLERLNYRRLIRALQVIFFVTAFIGGGVVAAFAGLITTSWLKIEKLPLMQVQTAIQFIGASIALRWMAGLYRGCIVGFEKLVWLSSFNSLLATLRFLCVLPILIWIDNSITTFFTYQLLVAVFEITCLFIKAHFLFPQVGKIEIIGWSPAILYAPVKKVLKFCLSIAFTSAVWVVVTQVDKLILSNFLPLTEYGYFTLAVLAASGVMIVSGPISSALLPRMARLQAQGDEAGLVILYRNATQMVAVIATPTCLMLAGFPKEIIWVWTGDNQAASQANLILCLYAIGNGFLAVSAFPYYLQFAKGDIKLHLIGNILFLLFFVPLLMWATLAYGGVGAASAWAFLNAIYFFLWTPYVHKRFAYGLHGKWLLQDLSQIVFCNLICICGMFLVITWPQERKEVLIKLVFCGAFLGVVSAFSSSYLRQKIIKKLLR